MESRRIALIVSPWYPVPPNGYGGIELMAYNLARELSNRGHQVTVLGQQGSRGPFETVALAPKGWTKYLGQLDETARHHLFLYRAYETVRRRAFDVVHDNSGPTGILVASQARLTTPVVATLHGALSEAEGAFLATVARQVYLVAISRAQLESVVGVDWRAVVHNSIDPAAYEAVTERSEKGDYLLELARINPDKGQHLAIEVAKRVDMPLVLAGKIDPSCERYFREQIEPHLCDRIRWIENVHGREKADLLARARAFLFPIGWPEPFGLAMVEAMASGTPVIAFARGAAPEVVDDGVTGFLVEDVDGMVEAIGRLDEIDLEECVETASRRYGPSQMTDGYLEVYERAMEQARYSAPPLT